MPQTTDSQLLTPNSIHIVAGPTASGKTSFAVSLAQQINGELINVDSRQIYKYLDIGTNKGSLRIKRDNVRAGNQSIKLGNKLTPVYFVGDTEVPIYLLSFLEPDQVFSAFAFRELVDELIPQIVSRGKVPILVGGTGLYIDVILHPGKYASESGTKNQELRNELNKLSKNELQQRVQNIGIEVWENLNPSDRENPRRLIRIVEKQAQQETPQQKDEEQNSKYQFVIHHIDLPMSELTAKIDQRVEEMFKQGIIKETQHVLEMGFSEKSVALQGIGYREVIKLLKGEISESQCIELVKIAHRHYAKRQKTWFKKYLPQS